jgi:hypothetical protein
MALTALGMVLPPVLEVPPLALGLRLPLPELPLPAPDAGVISLALPIIGHEGASRPPVRVFSVRTAQGEERMAQDFIPSADGDFLAWEQNFITAANNNLAGLGLIAPDLNNVTNGQGP